MHRLIGLCQQNAVQARLLMTQGLLLTVWAGQDFQRLQPLLLAGCEGEIPASVGEQIFLLLNLMIVQ